MKRSDYAQYKMEIYKLYKDVLRIAKKEDNPKEWYHYNDLLEEIAEKEQKCDLLREEIASFNFRK